MPLFNWSEKFILGIKKIDEEHKMLVDLINKLSDARQTNKSDEVIGRVLDGLVSYAESHLTNEEFLLKKYNYPEFHSHKSIHDDLRKQVLDLKKKYHEGNRDAGTNLAIFLFDWLAEHILLEDKKIAEYLISKKSEITYEIETLNNIHVGIQKIDDDHSKAIKLFNLIVSAKKKKKGHDLMGYINKLIEHWKMHFKYEEDLMEEYRYPGFEEHKKEHDKIANDFLSCIEMSSNGFNYAINTLSLNLNLWIEEHVSYTSGQDKKLAQYLISKGIT